MFIIIAMHSNSNRLRQLYETNVFRAHVHNNNILVQDSLLGDLFCSRGDTYVMRNVARTGEVYLGDEGAHAGIRFRR